MKVLFGHRREVVHQPRAVLSGRDAGSSLQSPQGSSRWIELRRRCVELRPASETMSELRPRSVQHLRFLSAGVNLQQKLLHRGEPVLSTRRRGPSAHTHCHLQHLMGDGGVGGKHMRRHTEIGSSKVGGLGIETVVLLQMDVPHSRRKSRYVERLIAKLVKTDGRRQCRRELWSERAVRAHRRRHAIIGTR